MIVNVVSEGSNLRLNEDWAGTIVAERHTDLIIIDGATSVSDGNYIDPNKGDVVWFVNSFTSELFTAIQSDMDQDEAVHVAIERLWEQFECRTNGIDVPVHAWPVAAMTWIRLTEVDEGWNLQLYCLGDCKALVRNPDGSVCDLDPFVNPQDAIVRLATTKLSADRIVDPAIRRAHLLPMLRARREEQNCMAKTNILCLRPNGRLDPRRYQRIVPAGSAVLAMTDGFYRLVDVYGLHTPETLAALCVNNSPQAALTQLRTFEATTANAGSSVKHADDASAIVWEDRLEPHATY
jgi:hypothetical protein